MTERPDADLLIVGGGPAGLVTALETRRQGVDRVAVLDSRRPPIDKPCGEGLMPDAVARLEALGVEFPKSRCAPFRGIRYLDGPNIAEGAFPGHPGLGVRRTVLHAALVEAAEAAGVVLHWGRRAESLLPATLEEQTDAPAGVGTEAGDLTARWVVAADGLGSRLRGWAGLDGDPRAAHRSHRRFGVRRHFWLAPWTDKVEVHWADKAEAYVTPVGPRSVGIAFLTQGEEAHFDALLERFPALAARLDGAEAASRVQGRGPLLRTARAVCRGRLALVGDAAGYVDAITGEGLALAFHQAAALGEALALGSLAGYPKAHARIGRFPDRLTRMMLTVERRPQLRRRVIAALAAEPALFDRILAVHCRALPLRRFGAGSAVRLLGRTLRASGRQQPPPTPLDISHEPSSQPR